MAPRCSPGTLALLHWEVANVNRFLKEFGTTVTGETRLCELGATAEFVKVLNMPLPDGYAPDFCDLLLVVNDFPARPPCGLYLLNTHRAQVRLIQSQFTVYRNMALYDAPAIPGYSWVCYHFAGLVWRYRPDAPAQGDNLSKFLAGFFAELKARGGR